MLQGDFTTQISKMNTFMKRTIPVDLPGKIIGLLFLFGGASVSGAQATDPMPSASAQAIVYYARLNLAEAWKTRNDPGAAVGYYLEAADWALQPMDGSSPEERSEAQSIYDSACQEVTVLLDSTGERWNMPQTVPIGNITYRLGFATGSGKDGTWDPSYFNFFRTPKQVHEKIAHQEVRINDWGGVLVGVYKPSDPRKYFLPRVGVACPVTAILDFSPSRKGVAGTRDVTLILYDPTRRSAVRVEGAQRPLAADFAAPLAYYPEPGLLLGLMAMIRPQKYEQQTGLYMLEPYDPDRIPVIFVHGLLSIPQMWTPTVSAVESDPELRGRYQFWVFAYPTGNPIALSALRLRESLAQVYQSYPKTKDMVLISHSMGGLLSQMQAVTTRRVLWDSVFKGDADRVYAALPPDNIVKRALIFDANPRVARIVFICVPHRGSNLAINWIGSIGIALIRLPGNILTGVSTVITAPLQKNLGLKRLPTGINGLSPQNPLLHGLDTLPIHAPYHSIIGDRGRGDTPNSSDGSVATLREWSDKLGRYGPRTLSCRSVQVAPI
jgi:pimeloyl-ACP methyl ester carboxylesterase